MNFVLQRELNPQNSSSLSFQNSPFLPLTYFKVLPSLSSKLTNKAFMLNGVYMTHNTSWMILDIQLISWLFKYWGHKYLLR